MIYDFTLKTPRILMEESDGHIVDKKIFDNLKNGNAVFYNTDENGHAVPTLNKEV